MICQARQVSAHLAIEQGRDGGVVASQLGRRQAGDASDKAKVRVSFHPRAFESRLDHLMPGDKLACLALILQPREVGVCALAICSGGGESASCRFQEGCSPVATGLSL